MDAIYFVAAALAGLLAGAASAYLYYGQRAATYLATNKTLSIQIDGLRTQIQTAEIIRDQMEQSFKALSLDITGTAIERLASQAGEKLSASGELIAQNLSQTKSAIGENLERVSSGLSDLLSRAVALDEGIKTGAEISQRLVENTHNLNQVLSSSQARGQWGERMVEDILNVLGLVEGINYEAQKSIDSGERPDFIFKLPDDKTINMDVKFPIDKYEEYIQAKDAGVRAAAEKAFLLTVRGHVKALANRGYIDPPGGTVDYLLMFIPNEAIYAFIHKHDPGLLDFSLERRIVLCSPITLYAILSLIRQSIKSFAMAAKTGEIMTLLAEFGLQWEKYVEAQTKMGESLEQASKRYDTMVTTRTRMLGRVVEKVGALERPQLKAAPADLPLELEG